MKFGTIASGSSGNCLYAGNEDTHILIDAGISCKRICEGLKTFELEGKDIQGILITHEHTDHICGLGVLSRKFHIPIYGTDKTLHQISEMENLGKIDRELFQPVEAGREFLIGSLSVASFSISHDAVDPVSYLVQRGHLCNEMAAQLVTELVNDQLDQVILGHLSKENNYPDLALTTVKNEVGDSVKVEVAPRDHAGHLFDLAL